MVGIYIGPDYKLSAVIEKAYSRAADPSAFLLEAALRSVFEFTRRQGRDEILNTCNRLLGDEGIQSKEHDWSSLPWSCLLLHLVDLGAPIELPIVSGNGIHPPQHQCFQQGVLPIATVTGYGLYKRSIIQSEQVGLIDVVVIV